MRPDPTPLRLATLPALAPCGLDPPLAHASMAGVALGAGVLLAAVLASLLLRRTRKPRPLSRVLLARSVKRADDP